MICVLIISRRDTSIHHHTRLSEAIDQSENEDRMSVVLTDSVVSPFHPSDLIVEKPTEECREILFDLMKIRELVFNHLK